MSELAGLRRVRNAFFLAHTRPFCWLRGHKWTTTWKVLSKPPHGLRCCMRCALMLEVPWEPIYGDDETVWENFAEGAGFDA